MCLHSYVNTRDSIGLEVSVWRQHDDVMNEMALRLVAEKWYLARGQHLIPVTTPVFTITNPAALDAVNLLGDIRFVGLLVQKS